MTDGMSEGTIAKLRRLRAERDDALNALEVSDKICEIKNKEIERLRAALQEIRRYAGDCMEGAGEPEFSQFGNIEAKAQKALSSW